jgi:hypothetical protein
MEPLQESAYLTGENAMTVDLGIKNLLSLYRSEIPGLLRDQRHFAELEAARDDLSSMLNCFDDDRIANEPQIVSAAFRLWDRVMKSDGFRNSSPGDNLLRLSFYILNVVSNDRNPRILERIKTAQVELAAINYGLEKGYIQQIVDLLDLIYENSAVLTLEEGRRPIPEIAIEISTLLDSDAQFLNSPMGEQLKLFAGDAENAFGGVSNPWVRKSRERAKNFGMELLTILEMEQNRQIISRSLLHLKNMQACFVNEHPVNYSALSESATQLFALVKDCGNFGDMYLGTELSSISGYLIRYLCERRKQLQ